MRLLTLAAFVFLCACGTRARAQAIEVAPVSITLAPEQRTASLTITNRGNASMVIQVRPFAWSENLGDSKLTETAALAVSPPFAEIAPGQAQSIRLLLRQAPGAAEATYRLLIDQLAPPNAPGVRVALRISLPVFAKPSARTAAALQWRIVPGRPNAELEVQNRGTQHAMIVGAQVTAPSGAAIPVRTTTHPYVLAGATSRWPIENARLPGSGSVRLRVTSDAGVEETTASVTSGAP